MKYLCDQCGTIMSSRGCNPFGCALPSLVTLRLRRPGSEEDRFRTPGLRYLDAHTGENERACESCGRPTFARGYGSAVHLREVLEDGTPGPFRWAGGIDRHVCHACLYMATGFRPEVAHA